MMGDNMLSKEQRLILDANHKYQLIIAGAGCGKTYTLIKKIEKMLAEGMTEILVISFTNLACQELIQRLDRSDVTVLTFHKLAVKILKCANHEHSYLDGFDSFFKFMELHHTPSYLKKILLCLLKEPIEILHVLSNKTLTLFHLIYFKDLQLFYWNTKIPVNILNLLSNQAHVNSRTSRNRLYDHITQQIDLLNIKEFIFKSDLYEALKKIMVAFLIKQDTSNIADYDAQDYYLYDMFSFIADKYITYMEQSKQYSYHYLLVKAIELLDECQFNYQLILVDEFQDINQTCLKLLQKLVLQLNAHLVCVGDDWQSIYGFAGSVPSSMNHFGHYFYDYRTFLLCTTFRYSQQLATISSAFVEKDDNVIKKQMSSQLSFEGPVRIVYYQDINVTLTCLLREFSLLGSLFILVRYHRQLKRIEHIVQSYDNVICLTIHKAKGLEAQNVIVLMDDERGHVFFDYLYKRKLDQYFVSNSEQEQYNEERRLFYVAITRSCNQVVLLNKKGKTHPFVQEVKQYV